MRNRKEVRDRVVVSQSQASPRIKIFSIRRVLTYNTEEYKSRGMLVDDTSGFMVEGLPLAKRIFELEGVEAVVISQYDIWVTIGRAFSWDFDELEDEVSNIIRNYLSILNMQEDASDKKPNNKKKPKPGK